LKENNVRINHLLFGFCLGAVISYVLLTSPYTSHESAYMLVIFNFLYVSLTFPLNGKLTTKLLVLLMGNVVGLFWNNLFSLFASVAANYVGEVFNILYIILNPLLNLIWIVSFWSTSLAVVTNFKDTKAEVQT